MIAETTLMDTMDSTTENTVESTAETIAEETEATNGTFRKCDRIKLDTIFFVVTMKNMSWMNLPTCHLLLKYLQIMRLPR